MSSFQDEKLVITSQARFKYQTLNALIKRYEPLIRLPPALQEEFNAYGGSGGWFICERFEKALKSSRINAPNELMFEIAQIVAYNYYRAEKKWGEFIRLRDKTILELPPELDEIVRACDERLSDSNLYQFENKLEDYWFEVKIPDIFRE